MDNSWQTWAAFAIVALAALLLVRSWWKRRGQHEGCDCPGTRSNREWRLLQRKIRR